MSPEEYAEKAVVGLHNAIQVAGTLAGTRQRVAAAIREAVAEAVAAERLACVLVAEEVAWTHPHSRHLGPERNALEVAARIRARGEADTMTAPSGMVWCPYCQGRGGGEDHSGLQCHTCAGTGLVAEETPG